MNEVEFRQRAADLGYGEPQAKDYAPNQSGDLHSHDFSAIAMVADGEFILEFEDGEVTYGPGDSCEVAAGTMHSEKTGSAGATVWFATK